MNSPSEFLAEWQAYPQWMIPTIDSVEVITRQKLVGIEVGPKVKLKSAHKVSGNTIGALEYLCFYLQTFFAYLFSIRRRHDSTGTKKHNEVHRRIRKEH